MERQEESTTTREKVLQIFFWHRTVKVSRIGTVIHWVHRKNRMVASLIDFLRNLGLAIGLPLFYLSVENAIYAALEIRTVS